jgi:capsular exopolysaccharide synthesis family protein
LLQQSAIENLSVLTSGPIPPNPSELLNSSVFRELSDKLLDHGCDHVVFDSPPVLSVSDPVVIASVVDTGILVVRAGRTARQAVRAAAEKLAKSNVAHFGVVLNHVDLDAAGSSYDYYHHYVGEAGTSSRTEPQGDHTRDATA